jgi:hypothetical protein
VDGQPTRKGSPYQDLPNTAAPEERTLQADAWMKGEHDRTEWWCRPDQWWWSGSSVKVHSTGLGSNRAPSISHPSKRLARLLARSRRDRHQPRQTAVRHALPATGFANRRVPDPMPEDITAWYRPELDVHEERRPGTTGRILTITNWDGCPSLRMMSGPRRFRDVRVAVRSDYLDVEIDATVPYQTGVSSTARPPESLGGDACQTLEFSLGLRAGQSWCQPTRWGTHPRR